jgi:hypothetical protein
MFPSLSLGITSCVELAAVFAAGFTMFLGGRVLLFGRGTPELQFVAGWGGYCALTTCWGVSVPASLSFPTAGFMLIGAAGLATAQLRPRREDWRALFRILVVSTPLWLVMTGIKPSQPDALLNLIPNAAYLWDNGYFPRPDSPASYSTLPALPYNHQLAAYLASFIAGRFLPGAMSLFSVLLHIAAGLLFARSFQDHPDGDGAVPPWWATTLGFALATLLNPGFTPRYSFSSYGEGPMAVAALFAAWLGLRLLDNLRAKRAAGWDCWSLALVFAAMINIKQMSIGLVAAIVGALAILVCLDRGIDRVSAFAGIVASLALPLALYAFWRVFVLTGFAGGELKPLPLAEWHWRLLPLILLAILEVIALKGVVYGLFVAAAVALVLRARHGLDSANKALLLAVLVFVLYTGFLLLAYVGQFPEEWSSHAHSYFRWSAHVALILVLAFVRLAWQYLRQIRAAPVLRTAGTCLCIGFVTAPLAFAERLRFDQVMPQPLVWGLAKMTARHLNDDHLVALVLPGDNGSVATMLELGVRLRARPDHMPDFIMTPPDAGISHALEKAAMRGATLAVVSCVPPDLADLPARSAAVLRRSKTTWSPVEIRPYAEPLPERWTPLLASEPFCKSRSDPIPIEKG